MTTFHADPTPYAEVNSLLRTLFTHVQQILQERLVGFYLYGSLALGDFDPPSSDVDFLAVTTEELRGEVVEELRSMHAHLAASGFAYATHVEGSYISRAALRRYDPQQAEHPTIGVDWEFGVAQHGINWVIQRWILREHGVVVWGPPPDTLIDPISADELRQSVCALLPQWQTAIAQVEWLRSRYYQALAVLTLCRMLYSLQHCTIVSKPVAAAWAIEALDPQWRSIIERAVIWRGQHEKDDLTETLAFLHYAIGQGMDLCKQ
ncbi:MAG: DUF4111 domain-containing protein [Ktedonobacteraceae bacterium]|nr:DUF4111 domain-containing protein [Ktedonobacteraceae bacterium]